MRMSLVVDQISPHLKRLGGEPGVQACKQVLGTLTKEAVPMVQAIAPVLKGGLKASVRASAPRLGRGGMSSSVVAGGRETERASSSLFGLSKTQNVYPAVQEAGHMRTRSGREVILTHIRGESPFIFPVLEKLAPLLPDRLLDFLERL